MKNLLLAFSFLVLFFPASAQNTEKAYYFKSGGIMGKTETIIESKGSTYILHRYFYGKLGGTLTDTLIQVNGKFQGDRFYLFFSDKGIILQHREDSKPSTPRKYRVYDNNDPFILSKYDQWSAWENGSGN